MTDAHHQQHSDTNQPQPDPAHHAASDQQGTGNPANSSLVDKFLPEARANHHVVSKEFAVRLSTKDGGCGWGQTDIDVVPGGRFLVRKNVIAGFATQVGEKGEKGFFSQLANDLFKRQSPGIREVGYRIADSGNFLSRLLYSSFVRSKIVHEPVLLKEIQNQSTTDAKSVHIATNKIGLPAICAIDLDETPYKKLIVRPGRCILQGMDTTVDFTASNYLNSAGQIGNLPKIMETISGNDVVIIGGASMLSVDILKDGQEYRADPDLVVAYTTKNPTMVLASTSASVNFMTALAKKKGDKQEKFLLASFVGPGAVIKLRDRDDDPAAPAPPPSSSSSASAAASAPAEASPM